VLLQLQASLVGPAAAAAAAAERKIPARPVVVAAEWHAAAAAAASTVVAAAAAGIVAAAAAAAAACSIAARPAAGGTPPMLPLVPPRVLPGSLAEGVAAALLLLVVVAVVLLLLLLLAWCLAAVVEEAAGVPGRPRREEAEEEEGEEAGAWWSGLTSDWMNSCQAVKGNIATLGRLDLLGRRCMYCGEGWARDRAWSCMRACEVWHRSNMEISGASPISSFSNRFFLPCLPSMCLRRSPYVPTQSKNTHTRLPRTHSITGLSEWGTRKISVLPGQAKAEPAAFPCRSLPERP